MVKVYNFWLCLNEPLLRSTISGYVWMNLFAWCWPYSNQNAACWMRFLTSSSAALSVLDSTARTRAVLPSMFLCSRLGAWPSTTARAGQPSPSCSSWPTLSSRCTAEHLPVNNVNNVTFHIRKAPDKVRIFISITPISSPNPVWPLVRIVSTRLF